ncbi:putative endonuclease [Paenibacillus castaneae]|uniref:YraN family protein n=1 Tax=Paenibacillus castaneae TaxID=474957 RepID=UPI000C9B2735|nr:YraN family protein [Paenibacillus castaneae]NIK75641.1 putative endonuclease [Paenibacillus castaneae]
MIEGDGTGSKLVKNDSRPQTGQLGEEAAYQLLLDADFIIRERNWRCRSGEIDIIAEYESRFVFVEVRTRKEGGKFGTAVESVDHRKRQKVRDTALIYLRSIGKSNALMRFDVIAVSISRQDGSILACKHYESAF